jgi:hypothetical protein
MLERSLTAMLLAVLPVSLGRFELPQHLVWGAPAMIFALAEPYLHIAPIRRMRHDPSYQPGLAYRLSGWLALVLILGLLVTGVVGLIPLQSAFGLALVIELSVAATMFLRVASSLMAIHKTPAA